MAPPNGAAVAPPNGAAVPPPDGAAVPPPDGAAVPPPDGGEGGGGVDVVVTDNGGYFSWIDTGSLVIPVAGAEAHRGGALWHVGLAGGVVAAEPVAVCSATSAGACVAPNDLVVDADGGVWFTDFGVSSEDGPSAVPGVGYLSATALAAACARVRAGGASDADAVDGPDAARAEGVVWGTREANGIGLAADGSTLYVAETHGASLWAFDVTGPGSVVGGGSASSGHEGRLLHRGDGVMFDSLAVDPDGWVCVATIGPGGGLTCVDPADGRVVRVGAPDDLTTNVAFVSVGDRVAAAVTLSATGGLAVIDDWRSVRDGS